VAQISRRHGLFLSAVLVLRTLIISNVFSFSRVDSRRVLDGVLRDARLLRQRVRRRSPGPAGLPLREARRFRLLVVVCLLALVQVVRRARRAEETFREAGTSGTFGKPSDSPLRWRGDDAPANANQPSCYRSLGRLFWSGGLPLTPKWDAPAVDNPWPDLLDLVVRSRPNRCSGPRENRVAPTACVVFFEGYTAFEIY